MDGRRNRRNKAVFLNFSGIGRTGPWPKIGVHVPC